MAELVNETVAVNLYRDTYLSLPAIGVAVGAHTQRVGERMRELGVRREPKYPRPLYRYVLRYVKLPRPIPRCRITYDAPRKPELIDPGPVSHDPRNLQFARERDKAKAVKLWADGVDADLIAARLGWTTGTIRRWLRAVGVDLKAPRHVYERANPYSRSQAERQGARADYWRRT